MNIVITITAETPAEAQRALLALAFPSPVQPQPLGQVTPRYEPLVAAGTISPAPAAGNGPTTSWETTKPTSWEVMKPAEAVELIEVADLPVPQEAEPPVQSTKRKPPPPPKR